jgi:tRNA dimethylallyltransferase
MNTDMILILGVTASGKGKLAFDLARRIDAEIISVDSMKVYRRMNIGTAKPPLQAQKIVQYHLIDLFEPSDSFSVASFYQIALRQIEQIKNKNKKVIAVGGTALYIKALLYGLFEGPGSNKKIRNELKARAEKEGLGKLHLELEKVDPEAARRIFVNDQRRIIRALEVYKLTGKPISSFQLQFNAEQPKYDWTIIGLRRKK